MKTTPTIQTTSELDENDLPLYCPNCESFEDVYRYDDNEINDDCPPFGCLNCMEPWADDDQESVRKLLEELRPKLHEAAGEITVLMAKWPSFNKAHTEIEKIRLHLATHHRSAQSVIDRIHLLEVLLRFRTSFKMPENLAKSSSEKHLQVKMVNHTLR